MKKLVAILLLISGIPQTAKAVTRFYLPISGTADVSPAFGGWFATTGATRIKPVTTKSNTALTSFVIVESTGANVNLLGRQYVSDSLDTAGDITGTVKGIIRTLEATTNEDAEAQILIRVVSSDGSTFRGTLVDFNNAVLSNEYATALTNRKFPRNWSGAGTSVATVTAQVGDRIVIEIGTRAHVGGEGSNSINFGDTGSTDCAEDETSTTANVPWIEFSQTLTFTASATTPPPINNPLQY